MKNRGAETSYMRSRVMDVLSQDDFRCVLDHLDDGGSWQGEFLLLDRDDEIAVWAQKPAVGPYVTIGVVVRLSPPASVAEFRELLNSVSDHDLCCWFDETPPHAAHLSQRILASGLSDEDLRFTLDNLMSCREGLLDDERERPK